MKPAPELRALVSRVKVQTRNADVLDLCDAVEEMLAANVVTPMVTNTGTVTRLVTPKRDRAKYMRGYRSARKAAANE